jgi:hypothetical protein
MKNKLAVFIGLLVLVGCGANWVYPECICDRLPEEPTETVVVPELPTEPELVADSGTQEEVDAGQPETEVDAGTPDQDAGQPEEECKPGYGYGDLHHCHSGPPGLNPDAGHPTHENKPENPKPPHHKPGCPLANLPPEECNDTPGNSGTHGKGKGACVSNGLGHKKF